MRLFFTQRKPMWLPALAFALMACAACGHKEAAATSDKEPLLFPDYRHATVPVNIAPLNFKINGADCVVATISLDNKEQIKATGTNSVDFDVSQWHKLLRKAAGRQIMVSVSVWNKQFPDGIRYKSFPISVSADAIDPYVAYRLIPPGYELWHKMGIYQRSLESFDEQPIVTNRQNHNGCVNCHSFCQYSPQRMMFHARGQGGGTVVWRDGVLRKIELEKLSHNLSGTYPMWHPSGRYIVFSSNDTRQSFYGHSQDKIEVYDLRSDLIVYDCATGRVMSDKRFLTPDSWETFPAFSPDGRWLYYCVAQAVNMPTDYNKLHYSLCRVAFDAHTGTLASRSDTVYSAFSRGGSVSFPRFSPDGRWLMYTWSECGTFPIHHKEADLRMVDANTGREVDVRALNSTDVDSYHAWSSNGRWVVFSSKRIDGRYTRLFIAHIDGNGRASRPFLLPQKRPDENVERMYSYNIPEFVKGKVKLDADKVAHLFD